MSTIKQIDIKKYEGMIKRTEQRNTSTPLTNVTDFIIGTASALTLGYVIGTAKSTKIVKFPYVDGTLL